jgi:hypothetical protein
MKVNYMLNSQENGRLPLTSKCVDYHRLFRVFPPMLNWGLWSMLAFSIWEHHLCSPPLPQYIFLRSENMIYHYSIYIVNLEIDIDNWKRGQTHEMLLGFFRDKPGAESILCLPPYFMVVSPSLTCFSWECWHWAKKLLLWTCDLTVKEHSKRTWCCHFTC